MGYGWYSDRSIMNGNIWCAVRNRDSCGRVTIAVGNRDCDGNRHGI